jgi:CheY-like chemotaxis protein/HAMP domain-containing protein
MSVFLLSHTFTRPVENLVAVVHALEKGNFEFPPELGSKDEVGEVTGAFDRMRDRMQEAQTEQKELEIWVESALGKSTTFEICLPHSTKAVLLPGEIQKEKPLAGRNERILVVEDEPGVLKLASEFLKAGGYNILEASEEAEALRIVNSHSGTIDIVLSDMVMPVMSGSELAETLKKIRPGTRVIHMSGYAEFSGKNGEQPPGETRVLQKPFSRNTLLEKCGKQCAQRPSVLKMARRWADRPDCRRAALFGT